MGVGHRSKPAWLRSAENQGLVSAMNATKWREATEAMRHLPGGPPRFRVKDFDIIRPSDWDRDWYDYPRPYVTIEWLEIEPDTRAEQVRSVLSAIGVPFVSVGEMVRIVGWLRQGAAPIPVEV